MSKEDTAIESSPLLYFFDSFPKEHLAEDGVPAALQAFETAIMLMAMGRWPAITGLIWQACEVFLALGYTESGEKSPKAITLQKRFSETGQITDSLNDKAHNMRQLRNRIFHAGYSPRDNEECIESFFNGGVPYLEALIKDVFDLEMFEVLEKDPSRHWLWNIYRDSKRALDRKLKRGDPAAPALLFFMLASKKINRMGGQSHSWFSPYNQVEMILGEHFQDVQWDVEKIKKNEMLRSLSAEDGLDDGYLLPGVECPVCLNKSILAKIKWLESDNAYKLREITRVGCFECEYVVADIDLVDVFFRRRLDDSQVAQLESDDDCYVTIFHL